MNERELVSLVRITGAAFDDAMQALLHDDKHSAREALRSSAVRRATAEKYQEVLHEEAPKPLVIRQIQLVDDLRHIGDLVDHLARRTLDGTQPTRLSPALQLEVTALLDAGGCRLRQLTVGQPAIGPEQRRTDRALMAVAERAYHDPSASIRLCAGLAITVLQASRHAPRTPHAA